MVGSRKAAPRPNRPRSEVSQPRPKEEEPGLSARQKVGVLMIALGQDAAAEVMKYLADMEVEQIAQAISELDVVTTEQEDEVLEEFEQLLVAGKYVSQGGLEFARGALEKALGPRKAQALLDRVNSTTSSGSSSNKLSKFTVVNIGISIGINSSDDSKKFHL